VAPQNRARTKETDKSRDSASATLKIMFIGQNLYFHRETSVKYQRREHLTVSREVGSYADRVPASNVQYQTTVNASSD